MKKSNVKIEREVEAVRNSLSMFLDRIERIKFTEANERDEIANDEVKVKLIIKTDERDGIQALLYIWTTGPLNEYIASWGAEDLEQSNRIAKWFRSLHRNIQMSQEYASEQRAKEIASKYGFKK